MRIHSLIWADFKEKQGIKIFHGDVQKSYNIIQEILTLARE